MNLKLLFIVLIIVIIFILICIIWKERKSTKNDLSKSYTVSAPDPESKKQSDDKQPKINDTTKSSIVEKQIKGSQDKRLNMYTNSTDIKGEKINPTRRSSIVKRHNRVRSEKQKSM